MSDKNSYSIGMAAQLTGLSTHTLRKWETRYGAVKPGRTGGGNRRYSLEDVERVAQLLTLVNKGLAISSIASLESDELEALVTSSNAPEPPPRIPAALLGDGSSVDLWEARDRMPSIEIVTRAEKPEDLAVDDVKLLILEKPSLTESLPLELEELRSALGIDAVLVIFRYGAIPDAEAISNHRTAVVSRPLNYRELERTASALMHDGLSPTLLLGSPPHRFSRTVLTNVAQMSGTIACECPRHIALLLLDLADFEAYSADCENLQPDDAKLHNMLKRTAASARALFENAMVEIAEAEDIDLDLMEARP